MTYPGGKGAAGTAQTIINEQPPHRIYIEPFLGSGAVLRLKRPAAVNIGIDVDAGCIASWGAAARPDFTFSCKDSLTYLRSEALPADTLIYADPPYPLSSRARPRRYYKHEMTDAQHCELLLILQSLPCMVQLSTYSNPMYDEALRSWRLVTFQSATRGGMATEYLYMNYPAPAALHDYRFLGRHYRERERIRRKTVRWAARLARLPALERLALYSAIASTINSPGDADLNTK